MSQTFFFLSVTDMPIKADTARWMDMPIKAFKKKRKKEDTFYQQKNKIIKIQRAAVTGYYGYCLTNPAPPQSSQLYAINRTRNEHLMHLSATLARPELFSCLYGRGVLSKDQQIIFRQSFLKLLTGDNSFSLQQTALKLQAGLNWHAEICSCWTKTLRKLYIYIYFS